MLQAWPQNFSWGPKYQNWSHKYWVDFGKWLVGIYKEWMNGRIKPGINCREVIFQTLKCWIHRSRRSHSSFLWNDVVLFSVNNGVEVTLIILKWWKVLLRLFQYLVSLCTNYAWFRRAKTPILYAEIILSKFITLTNI